MLFKTLDHLRTKPKETRKQVAFATALAVTLIVGGVWSLTLPARFAPQSTIATTEGTGPFAGVWAGFREQINTMRQQAGLIASTISSTTAATTTVVSATSSDTIDLEALLASTTLERQPTPAPILIGTTSATSATTTIR